MSNLNNASLYLIFPCELIDKSVRETLFFTHFDAVIVHFSHGKPLSGGGF